MKTPAELIHDAATALGAMEDKCKAIHDYSTLLGVLLAGPDADTALDGMHRICSEIRGLADDLRAYHDDASQAVQRLAKP